MIKVLKDLGQLVAIRQRIFGNPACTLGDLPAWLQETRLAAVAVAIAAAIRFG
ncbi:MAG: hypothetical protein RMY16_23390 [Nostoc sp. DedQUE12b]|uniref:hypothetical protein n=1 Tax=Nostoc sp. DedQUE12b TaxID=3075398 RepID=UPI002AD361D3|nr:hypothetical protein [Nostoc sp. DedQUE12b]MDZ8088480.1 hypothetical protein [Nostoc sp. DedQUE12b]